MLRVLLCSTALLAFLMAGATVQAQKSTQQGKATAGQAQKKGHEATITKVDAKKGTITVSMKDKTGKKVEKTFKLAEDVRYFDSTGRAARIDVFRAGNQILVIEEAGRLREIHQQKGKTAPRTRRPSKPIRQRASRVCLTWPTLPASALCIADAGSVGHGKADAGGVFLRPEHHLDAAILLVAEHLVRARPFLQLESMRDNE